MIIKANKNLIANGSLIKMENHGDQFKWTHAEEVGSIQEHCHEMREHTDNGWTKKRTLRQVGSVPLTVFLKYPEFYSDTRLIIKWLQTEEGRPYQTVKKGL